MTERLHFHFSLFTFHFHALEKEMATHSSVLAWRIPGMGSHRVGYNWSDLAAVAASKPFRYNLNQIPYDYRVEVRNRFKGLDLIERAWWTMNRGSWHCIGDRDQDHHMEKKCKKAKWLPEEALKIAVKWREVKCKGEKERYSHLNAEFQRIARRDKKAFLSEQCKERGKQQNGKD